MNIKPKVSVVVTAIMLACGAQAQSLPDPLIQAARKAVQTNPEVQARWNGFLAAGNERDVARGGYFPQVDLSASTGLMACSPATKSSAWGTPS